MSWFEIWFMKPLAELAFALCVFLVICFALFIAAIPKWIRQARCKHERFHETMACDAICTDCGKNLGFIGTWRDKLKRDKNSGS